MSFSVVNTHAYRVYVSGYTLASYCTYEYYEGGLNKEQKKTKYS